MSRRHFYARFNMYGSGLSVGFADAWRVAIFDSRAERDAWVAQHSWRLDVAAVDRRQARTILDGDLDAVVRVSP